MKSKNRRRSQGVACRCHQVIFFKWGTFGVIQIYFRLFALFWKNKYIFQYHSKISLNKFIRINRNYLFGSFEITSIRLYTPLRKPLHPMCTTWLRLFLHEPNKNCDQSLNKFVVPMHMFCFIYREYCTILYKTLLHPSLIHVEKVRMEERTKNV